MDSGRYCTMLQTFFGYGTTKVEAKYKKYVASTGWCNGPHGKAKRDFSLGNVSRPIISQICEHYWLARTLNLTARHFPVGVSDVKSVCYPNPIQELKQHYGGNWNSQ